MGAHTTSDDPTRYRVDAEVELWKHRDPVERVKSYLIREHQMSPKKFEEVAAEADQMAAELRVNVLSMPDPEPLSIFDHAYAEPHPLVEEGRRDLADFVGGAS